MLAGVLVRDCVAGTREADGVFDDDGGRVGERVDVRGVVGVREEEGRAVRVRVDEAGCDTDFVGDGGLLPVWDGVGGGEGRDPLGVSVCDGVGDGEEDMSDDDGIGSPVAILVGEADTSGDFRTATLRLRMVALRTPASLASQE